MGYQSPGITNELRLWHGSDADTAVKILKNGYDRGFVGVNANYHGRGAYFAVSSAYSQHKRYAKPDANGVQRMYLNDVLTGYYIKVNEDDTVLPVRKQTANEVILYDSAVNDMGNILMFIIFHDTQAYPRYLIEFK